MEATDQSIIGTHYITCFISTLYQLKRIMGEPTFIDDDSELNWIMETESGNVFTIYSHKENHAIQLYEQIEWHIGARDNMSGLEALEEIKNAIKNIK